MTFEKNVDDIMAMKSNKRGAMHVACMTNFEMILFPIEVNMSILSVLKEPINKEVEVLALE